MDRNTPFTMIIPEEEIVAMLDEFKAEVNTYLAKYPDR